MFWPEKYKIASSIFKEPSGQVETQMSSNNEVMNVLNVWACYK